MVQIGILVHLHKIWVVNSHLTLFMQPERHVLWDFFFLKSVLVRVSRPIVYYLFLLVLHLILPLIYFSQELVFSLSVFFILLKEDHRLTSITILHWIDRNKIFNNLIQALLLRQFSHFFLLFFYQLFFFRWFLLNSRLKQIQDPFHQFFFVGLIEPFAVEFV